MRVYDGLFNLSDNDDAVHDELEDRVPFFLYPLL